MTYPTFEAAKEAKEKGEAQPEFEIFQKWYDENGNLMEVIFAHALRIFKINTGQKVGFRINGVDKYYMIANGDNAGFIYAKPTE